MARKLNVGGDPGRVEIVPCDPGIAAEPGATTPRALYRWLPPADLSSDLSSDFCFDFVVYDDDGIRRFLPLRNADQMIHYGFLAGIAMLSRDPAFTREDRNRFRAMKLIFDRGQQLKEHQTRRFKSQADLYVCKTGRGGGVQPTVLPCSLGTTADGVGQRWSTTELISKGVRRAKLAGHQNPTCERAITYGLLAAAERNPLVCQARQLGSLVRLALFDLSDADIKQGRRKLNAVTERVFQAIETHLDDSQAEFDKWFSGPNSNLMKTIASLRAPGPRLTVDQARWGFLELVWRSYQYMTRCIDVFCRRFMLALPARLNRREANLFRQMYLPQSYLGGLSLVLVKERLPQLGPILSDLWENPKTSDARFILYRVLNFYADMVEVRRAADRKSKQLSAASESVREERTNVEQIESFSSQSPSVANQLMEYIRAALEQRGLGCPKCDAEPEVQIPRDTPKNGPVTVEYWCPQHGNIQQAELSLAELKKVADDSYVIGNTRVAT
jgi:hypothetical protein